MFFYWDTTDDKYAWLNTIQPPQSINTSSFEMRVLESSFDDAPRSIHLQMCGSPDNPIRRLSARDGVLSAYIIPVEAIDAAADIAELQGAGCYALVKATIGEPQVITTGVGQRHDSSPGLIERVASMLRHPASADITHVIALVAPPLSVSTDVYLQLSAMIREHGFAHLAGIHPAQQTVAQDGFTVELLTANVLARLAGVLITSTWAPAALPQGEAHANTTPAANPANPHPRNADGTAVELNASADKPCQQAA
ncbi:hypothetical protein [Corynebacterium aquilae]|uniref:Uncharacterized protein n=1 Tax=Corynebacterium aquilae DSM 44791 TaxID=1431546 RepID=A0A1L7CEW8_9CORY|nr:hypothetical protein [Corynebacterium aquilae]APT84401.1 hypothetical protein CAQU_04180 [Corynebacterium aquilae DSM 44791]